MDNNTLRFFNERNEAIRKAKDELWEEGPFYRSEMAQYTIQLAFEKGSEWMKQRTIEKAVKWLKENADKYVGRALEEYDMQYYGCISIDNLIEDFKQAMLEE